MADYVIDLNGDQGNLREDVELIFSEHLERDIGGDFVKKSETVDAGHGRIETRRYSVCSDIEWLRVRHDLAGPKGRHHDGIHSRNQREIRIDPTVTHFIIR